MVHVTESQDVGFVCDLYLLYLEWVQVVIFDMFFSCWQIRLQLNRYSLDVPLEVRIKG